MKSNKVSAVAYMLYFPDCVFPLTSLLMTIFNVADSAGAVTDPVSCLKPASYPTGFFGVGLLHWVLEVHAG